MNFFSGCDAVARGAWEAGVRFVTAYPGSPTTGIVEAAARLPGVKVQWQGNEKVALETAAGAAYSGARTLAVMKHVGLNVAADPLFNLAYTGVEGGLVVAVGDDPGAKCSQNEQDSRLLALAANLPVLEPANVAEAMVFTRLAFTISERFDLPVIVRLTTPMCYGTGGSITSFRRRPRPLTGFARPMEKYLLLPKNVVPRHRALLANLKALGEGDWSRFFLEEHLPPGGPGPGSRYAFGIVCSGYPSTVVKELFGDRVPLLKVGLSFPLDESGVRRFAARCERLLVVEECSTFLETRIRALGLRVARRDHFDGSGEFQLRHLYSAELPQVEEHLRALELNRTASRALARLQPSPAAVPLIAFSQPPQIPDLPAEALPLDVPARPPGFCAGCPHTGVFHSLSRRRLYVVGDIGCYTLGALEPFNAHHANLCMGASLGVLQGYLATLEPEAARQVVAVIGDSTFFHSGMTSLLSAVGGRSPGTFLILDNSGTAMTGFQDTTPRFDKADWERLLAGFRVPRFAVVDALDQAALDQRLDEFLAADELSVLVVKGMCVQGLPPKGPTNFRYNIIQDRCTQCEECLTTDCPSLQWRHDPAGARIEITNECIGCGLCSQTCPEKAILPMTVTTGSRALNNLAAQVPWASVIRKARSIGPLRSVLERFERELP